MTWGQFSPYGRIEKILYQVNDIDSNVLVTYQSKMVSIVEVHILVKTTKLHNKNTIRRRARNSSIEVPYFCWNTGIIPIIERDE